MWAALPVLYNAPWVFWAQMLLTNFENAEDELPAIALHYLPLNHIAGHISLLKAFCRGGTIYFTRCADMSTFFEVPSLLYTGNGALVTQHLMFLSRHSR